VYRRTGSLAIKADSAHYASDILTNIAVVGALLGGYFGWLWLDPVIALVVAMVLLKSVYSIVVMALDVLMDKALEPEAEQQIADLIEAQTGVRGFHDLKTRQAGAVQFIQLHLELEASQPLHQAHATGDRVEQAIRAVFPRAEVLIHHDPV